jgi:hypothetical protein
MLLDAHNRQHQERPPGSIPPQSRRAVEGSTNKDVTQEYQGV